MARQLVDDPLWRPRIGQVGPDDAGDHAALGGEPRRQRLELIAAPRHQHHVALVGREELRSSQARRRAGDERLLRDARPVHGNRPTICGRYSRATLRRQCATCAPRAKLANVITHPMPRAEAKRCETIAATPSSPSPRPRTASAWTCWPSPKPWANREDRAGPARRRQAARRAFRVLRCAGAPGRARRASPPRHLGVCTYELFGDYTPKTERIRVWMRHRYRRGVEPQGAAEHASAPVATTSTARRSARPESYDTRGFYAHRPPLSPRARHAGREAPPRAGSSVGRSGRSTGVCWRAADRRCAAVKNARRRSGLADGPARKHEKGTKRKAPMVKVGLFVRLEAKPGKESAVAEFLERARAGPAGTRRPPSGSRCGRSVDVRNLRRLRRHRSQGAMPTAPSPPR